MSFLSYLGNLTARFRMVLGHQLALLVFVFLVVFQSALGDDLGIISSGVSCCMRDFCFALDSFCSLGPGRTSGHVLLWVIGMSNIVHALVLSSTGIAVRVALARFHLFGEADAGLHFLPTTWTI